MAKSKQPRLMAAKDHEPNWLKVLRVDYAVARKAAWMRWYESIDYLPHPLLDGRYQDELEALRVKFLADIKAMDGKA